MTTRYVAITGNDTSGDGSIGSPWRSIQKACNSAVAGDTIVIASGTYAPFSVTGKNLYIEAASGATVIVQPVSTYAAKYSKGEYVDGVLQAKTEFGAKISGWTAGRIKGIRFRNARYQWGAGVQLINCRGTGAEGSRSIKLEDLETDHNHSFGVYVQASSGIDILNLLAWKNDTGAQISQSYDVYMLDPVMHDNDQLVDDGRGGNGICFYRAHDVHIVGTDVAGYGGALFYNHRSNSPYYDLPPGVTGWDSQYRGRDGGAFEYYESWNIVVEGVRGWQNHNVLETGQGVSTARSDGLLKHHCLFYASDPNYPAPLWAGRTYGMVLRAAAGGLVHHNTYYGLGKEIVLVMAGGDFAGAIAGLGLRDNIEFGAGAGTRCESVPVGADVDVDWNLLYNPGGSLGNRTGDNTNGVLGQDPLFVSRDGRDFRLSTGSPAIGAGSDGSDLGAIPSAVTPPPPPPDPEDPPEDPDPPAEPEEPDPPSTPFKPGKGKGKGPRRMLLAMMG